MSGRERVKWTFSAAKRANDTMCARKKERALTCDRRPEIETINVDVFATASG